MKRKLIAFGFFILALGISSCDNGIDYDALQANEMRYFNLYMNTNYPGEEPSELNENLYFIEYEPGDSLGLTPDSGDYVLINYVAYTIPDEDVVDTYDEDWAINNSLYDDDVLYGPYKYQHGTEIEGMKLGLSLMKEGGMARLIFTSALGYGSESNSPIDAYESLMYDIQLLKVIKDPVTDAEQRLNEYMDANYSYDEISTVYGDTAGAYVYFIAEQHGDSTLLVEGSVAEVFYTGQLLDGREFDSNASSSSGLKVTIGEGDVIEGWEIGLTKFRYGSTGRLIIPYHMAYGETGSFTTSGKTAIPPYEPLIFDIEVTKTVYEDDK